MIKNLVVALVPVILAVACGSSPPVRYFSLDTVQKDYQPVSGEALLVGMGPLRIPSYLDRTHIVTRQQGTEMVVNEFVRWAEPLDKAVHRTLATNTDSLLDSASVLAYPTSAIADVQYRVVGNIERFEADENGEVVLAIQWGITDDQGTAVAHVRRSVFSRQIASPTAASTIANAMSQLLFECSEEMAAEIRKISE